LVVTEAALQAVVISGGVAHDFTSSSAALLELLNQVGVTGHVREDVDVSLAGLPGRRPDLVVLNLLRWTMQVDRYAALRDEWSISLSAAARAGLTEYLQAGGGLLAMHGASICFDDWPQWKALLGAVWRWETSFHPPLAGPVRISVAASDHPIVAGVPDFDIVDEVYGFLDRAPDVAGLMSGKHSGAAHPLLWARQVGSGRVVYDALGHDARSYEVPEHRRLVQRAALWAAGVI